MSNKINIFIEKGFTSAPFHPMGVTELLEQKVPPPVGFANQIARTLKEFEKMSHYSKMNLGFAVVGDYGSGKTNFMKYVYRMLTEMKINVSFHKFDANNPSIKNIIKEARSIYPEDKLYILIDEVDDIPRLIKEKIITSSQANSFLKEIAAVFEPDGSIYPPPKDIVIVLGMGHQSWKYFEQTRPDIIQSRFRGKTTTLRSPKPWQMVGLVRRNIYFHSVPELKKKIDNLGYFPFPEGISLALAKFSAITEANRNLNTRFIVKFFDRLLFYLLNISGKSEIEEFTNFHIRKLLKEPEQFQIEIEGIETSLKKVGKSLTNISKKLCHDFGITDEELIDKLIFRIYFDHSFIYSDELKELENTGIPLQIFDYLVSIGVLEKFQVIDYIEEVALLINRASLPLEKKSNDVKYLNVYESYNIDSDLILHSQDWKYNDRVIKEIKESLIVEQVNFDKIEDDHRSLFNKYGKTAYKLSQETWNGLINENLLEGIEIKGFPSAKNKFKLLTPSKIENMFYKNFNNVYSGSFETDRSHIIFNSPKIDLYLIWETPKRSNKKQIDKIINSTFENHKNNPSEGVIILLPSDQISEITEYVDFNDEVQHMMDLQLLEDESFPIIFYQIPVDYIVYIIFKTEIQKDNDKTGQLIPYQISEFIEKIVDFVSNYYSERHRLPLIQNKFSKNDIKNVNTLIHSVWNKIMKGEDNITIIQEAIKLKDYGDEFYFDSSTLLSPIEEKIVDILKSKNRTSYRGKDLKTEFDKKFCLSLSHYSPHDLIHILSCKGLIISNKKFSERASANLKFTPNNGKENNELIKKLDKSTSHSLVNIQQSKIIYEFCGMNYSFTKGSNKIYDELTEFSNKLEDLNKKNKEISNLWKISDVISGEFLITLDELTSSFNNALESYNSELLTYDNKINKRLNELKTIIIPCEQLSDKIIELKLNESEYLELFEEAADASAQEPMNRDILHKISQCYEDIDEKIRGDTEFQFDKETIQNISEKFEMLHSSIKNFVKGVDLNVIDEYFEEIGELNSFTSNVIYPQFNSTLIVSDLPYDSKIRLKFKELISNKIAQETMTIERVLKKIRDIVKQNLNDCFNFLSWINKRGSNKWELWKQHSDQFSELQNLSKILDTKLSGSIITSDDFDQFIFIKESLFKLGKLIFKKNWIYIWKLGIFGYNKSFDPGKLFDQLDKHQRKELIDELLASGLLIQSLST